MERRVVLIRTTLLALLPLLLSGCAGSAGPSRALEGECLVLGFGQWAPARPDWLPRPWFETPPPIQLRPERHDLASIWSGDWKAVGPASTLGRDTVWQDSTSAGTIVWHMRDFLAAWSAPTAESLHVSRPASLSWGLQVRGRWRGDTLRGRAVAHTDVVRPEFDPRANVLAVLYRCADRQAARVASQALDAFMAADRVDSRQNQREILFLQTRFDRHIPQP